MAELATKVIGPMDKWAP